MLRRTPAVVAGEMPKQRCGSLPRALGGGRSQRYEARREARAASRSYAPRWTDATAEAVISKVKSGSQAAGLQVTEYVVRTLQDDDARVTLAEAAGAGMSPAERHRC